jgi:hypothetical protein
MKQATARAVNTTNPGRPPGRFRKGAPETNIKSIARAAGFLGSLLLLYAVATGLSLQSAAVPIDAAGMQRHSIA